MHADDAQIACADNRQLLLTVAPDKKLFRCISPCVPNAGPEDHLTTCNGTLVFIDVDNDDAEVFKSFDGGVTWSRHGFGESRISPCLGNHQVSHHAGLAAHSLTIDEPLRYAHAVEVLCASGHTLDDRDSGYTVATLPNYGGPGLDRIMIIGGDVDDTDVWVSDDCGSWWNCLEMPDEWSPREFTWMSPAPWTINPNVDGTTPPTMFMGGGISGGYNNHV